METKIILSSTSESTVKKAVKEMGDRKFKWTYLGEDSVNEEKITKLLGKAEYIRIASIVQENAKDLRQKYIDYIGKLSLKNNSLEWWANPLSDKNPYVSKSFFHSCLLKTALDLLSIYEKNNLILFVENDAVKNSMLDNVKSKKIIVINSFIDKIFAISKHTSIFLLYHCWFLFKNIYSIFVSRYIYGIHKEASTKKSLYLLYSPINSRSFDKEGKYHESFFGELKKTLETRGKETAILPFIWLPLRQYNQIIKNMKRSESVFIVPHAFMSIMDAPKILLHSILNKPENIKYPFLDNMNISSIINSDLYEAWIRTRQASNLWFYDMVKGLKRNKINIDTFIYIYENLAREKIMCIAFRKFYSSTYLIGYQHSAFPKMRLDYFFSNYESEIHPLPDRIITNGEYYKNLLVKSAYPKDKVVKGTGIRYKYLADIEEKKLALNSNNPTILVTPSIDMAEVADLLMLAYKSFGDKKEYTVIIKCHPFLSFKKINAHLKLKLPSNFHVSEDGMNSLLMKADILLYTSSTTSVEALRMGVPVIHIESSHFLDLDPLGHNPSLRCSVNSPRELLRCINELMAMDKKTFSEKREIWKDAVLTLLDKIDYSTYQLFLRSKS